MFSTESTSLLEIAHHLRAQLDRADEESGDPDLIAESEARIADVRASLASRGDELLTAAAEIRAVESSVAATLAANALEPALRALSALRVGVAPQRLRTNLLIAAAYKLVVEAAHMLARVETPIQTGGTAQSVLTAERAEASSKNPVGREGSANVNLLVLKNIATFHREHERYYTSNQLAEAGELSREANRLKVIAEAWVQPSTAAKLQSVDFSDPRYQAAGCDDLNALSAIPSIGILFMEGQGEPAEIRALKAKLRGMAMGLAAAGQWLGEKMEAAWERERLFLADEYIDAAWPRFQTIITNWQGSRASSLVGRLLSNAADTLDRIDFAAAALRKDLVGSAARLRLAGWLLDLGAQVLAKSGADLARNTEPRPSICDNLPRYCACYLATTSREFLRTTRPKGFAERSRAISRTSRPATSCQRMQDPPSAPWDCSCRSRRCKRRKENPSVKPSMRASIPSWHPLSSSLCDGAFAH